MPIKSYKMIYQGVGRIRIDFPKVIDIVDSDTKSKEHYRLRKKEYIEMNSEFKEIKIEDEEIIIE